MANKWKVESGKLLKGLYSIIPLSMGIPESGREAHGEMGPGAFSDRNDGVQPVITTVVSTGNTQRYHVFERAPEQQQTVRDVPTETQRGFRDFPDDPEERRGNMLMSTNFGPKSFTIHLLPQDGSMRDKAALREDYFHHFSDTGIAVPSSIRDQPENYCNKTFVNHGLVAREFTITSGSTDVTLGFGLTEAGQQYAVPAASLALTFEDEHDMSLYPILGNISTAHPTSVPAPFNRAKVLEILDEYGETMEFQDMIALSEIDNKTLGTTVIQLHQQGLVNYRASSGRIGKERVVYDLGDVTPSETTPAHPDTVFSGHVTDAIHSLLHKGELVTREAVRATIPKGVQEQYGEKSVTYLVHKHIDHFLVEDVLRTRDHRHGHVSDLAITDKGKLVAEKFLTILDGIVTDDPTAHAKAAAMTKKIKSDTAGYARRAAEVFKPYAKSSIRIAREETMERLTEEVSHHDDGITVANLRDVSGVNQNTIRHYLNTLEKRGVIETSIVRGARVVRMKPQTAS